MKEKKFIAECIRAYTGNYKPDRLAGLFNVINLENLNKIIIQQNIGGFFYHLYINNFFQKLNLPQNIISNWKKTAGKNSLINFINDNESIWFTGLLERNNIDYIYLKGLCTRIRCYDNDYIKYSIDIDLFIKKDDYEKIKEILFQNNYKIPLEHYTQDIAITIPFKEFEKNEAEISFIKRQGSIATVIDLQWDFIDSDKRSIFHKLYNINQFFNFASTDLVIIEGKKIKVTDIETEIMNISFHYAFHHSFRGVQWLLDICSLLRKHKERINFKKILDNASADLKKILGIVLMLASEFNHKYEIDKNWKKSFYVDRLLPFEYRYYRSCAFKPISGVSNSVSLLMTKILLPYRVPDRIRSFNYMLFNPDSITHRLDPEKKPKSFFLPFYLFKLLIFDIIRKRRS